MPSRSRVQSLLPLPLLFLAACQGATPKAATGARGADTPSRVLLLSLDGAGSEALHRYYAEGALDGGGFARFFKEGVVADAMVPVNPTLTSTNHISLAAGYDAAATGIVSNTFHPPGEAWGKTVSGFDAPIATETLWEAAMRQGKKVGNVTWPGADAKEDRRHSDWGVVYSTDRRGTLVTFERNDWTAWNPAAEDPKVTSYAPSLTARIDLPAKGPSFDLVAVDSVDDGVTRYDRLLVLPQPRAAATSVSPGKTLGVGEWLQFLAPPEPPVQTPGVSVVVSSGKGQSDRWIKVLKVDGDLKDVRLYFGPAHQIQAYPEPFAAELTRKGLLWPGAPDSPWLQATFRGQPGIDLATWTEQADRFLDFFSASLNLAAARSDWDLLMGYIPSIDEAGHTLSLLDPRQPNYSPELKEACARARLEVWKRVDRALASLLSTVDLRTTRVVVVSDHGMTPIHTVLDPRALLLSNGYIAVDAKGKILPEKSTVLAVSDGGISHLYLAPSVANDPAARTRAVGELKTLFAGWKVGEVRPLARVLTRFEAAALGLNHPNSGDVVLFAEEGYTFKESGDLKEPKPSGPAQTYGMHGYLNTNPDMQSVFLVVGAGVKPGKLTSLSLTEVAGKVAAWLGIQPPRREVPVSANQPANRSAG
ncbi:MAG TPA: alkaline phosphatase family protein, partial [Thermoanaerobaculia bacterium]|nr:alkaline phosphatase family protein [Thermoanaerobaculia bacterium]